MTIFSEQSEQSIRRIRELMASGGCDLHLHTHCSDGSDSPAGLVDRVLQAGLYAFAITDHDTLSAIEPAQAALEACASDSCLETAPLLIPGVELSVDDGLELHLLGYFPFGGESALEPFLRIQRTRREKRNQRMLAHLAELGYPLDIQDFRESGEEVLGRMQVALLLVKCGFFTTVSDAFDQLLGEGRPGYMERHRPSIAEAIHAIRSAGGAAVLAHPALYGWCGEGPAIKIELLHRLQRYQALGLQGIEAYHGEASVAVQLQAESAARITGLVATGGSDDHGKHKQHAHLYQGGRRFGERPSILVTAALIDGLTAAGEPGLMLTRRSGPRSSAGLWEFPGGKIEAGEAPEACLARELIEELGVRSEIGPLVMALTHDYDELRVVLLCFQAVLLGDPRLDPDVHDACRYATLKDAREMDLLAADYFVLDELERCQVSMA